MREGCSDCAKSNPVIPTAKNNITWKILTVSTLRGFGCEFHGCEQTLSLIIPPVWIASGGKETTSRHPSQRISSNSSRKRFTGSVSPYFQSLHADQNRKTLARRKGRKTATIGLKSRCPPIVRNTWTRSDHLSHLLRSDQLSIKARSCTAGITCEILVQFC